MSNDWDYVKSGSIYNRNEKLLKDDELKLLLIESVSGYPVEFLDRATRYLISKETKSSNEIEAESISPNKLIKFISALETINNEELTKEKLIDTLNIIKEKHYHEFDYRVEQNYLGDSFGLKSFVSPSVKHTIIRPTTKSSKTVAKDRTPKETAKREIKPKVKNGPKYVNINISFILIVVIISALFYYKFGTVKEYYNNYASIIPFFYSSPNEYIAKNLNEPPVMSVLTLVDKLSSPCYSRDSN